MASQEEPVDAGNDDGRTGEARTEGNSETTPGLSLVDSGGTAVTFSLSHTSCLGCIFAVKQGFTQTGCQLGRTEIFQSQGVLVQVYNEQDEFFVVNGRFCLTKRNEAWGEKAGPARVETVLLDTRVRLDYVVVNTENNLETLTKTLQSISAQTYRPNRVIVSNSILPPGQVRAALQETGLDWRNTTIIDEMTLWGRVDEAVVHSTGSFYAVFQSGDIVPPTFGEELNNAIQIRLERFSVLVPDDNFTGLVVQTPFHQSHAIGGNRPGETMDGKYVSNIIDKARHYAEVENKPYLVARLEEHVQCMSPG